jgi:hypothetical protein
MIRNNKYMIKTNLIIPALLLLSLLPAGAQVKKQETVLKREVTLYNPYKPSLSVIKKMSFLPDMNDTSKVKPEFHYAVSAKPFLPEYTISPIKPAALLPDPLPKLYKSFVNIGLGNYVTPLAEISITNERSKKGAVGIYGRHFSSNGKVELENTRKVPAGYMDNDASLFGKRFFKKSTLESSIDFTQKVRYAYGYDPGILDYFPQKKDIRMSYNNIGAKASLASLTMDSTEFYYDFDLFYNYFHHTSDFTQHNAGFDGIMAKSYKGFFVGSGISYEYYKYSDSLGLGPEYIASLSPFIKKTTQQWNFKLGFQALIDRNSILHFYPDVALGFTIIPSYLSFFSSLTGRMEKNEPLKVISDNPFLVSTRFPEFVNSGVLFRLPDTDHKLVISAGLKGNTGVGGSYLVSATYSIIDNMLFYSNLVFPDSVNPRARGNYFLPLTDAVNLINLHAEMNGPVNDKISFNWMANIYDYSTNMEYAWNKPSWDAKAGLKYNLRDKIIAGMELTAIGKRRQLVSGDVLSIEAGYTPLTIETPVHINLNLTAEYRYSKILSFWARLNNISYNHYYEWAYYPSQRFICMVGFTYSL